MAKALLPSRIRSKELIELPFHQPYTKAQFIVDAGLARRRTAASCLKALETAGVLESRRVGRETLYLNLPLYDLLALGVASHVDGWGHTGKDGVTMPDLIKPYDVGSKSLRGCSLFAVLGLEGVVTHM